jgi:O-antigen ligase/tetratricopeptide (TPR) repeat protein
MSRPAGASAERTGPSGWRASAAAALGGLMEAILLAAVVLSPWFYGAVEPSAEFALYVTLAVLLVLWGLRILLQGAFHWHHCPVALCLGGLFLLGMLQTTPLPREVLDWISPGTVRMYDRLLPAEPEVVPGQQEPVPDEEEPGPSRAGLTLSLYPAAMHRASLHLLAVFLIFVLVRNNLASSAALRRLSAVVLVNGAFLSVFALLQRFSSPRNRVYWSVDTLGGVFGPFICENHFAFYVNICLGLGLGLLFSLQISATASRPQSRTFALKDLPSLIHDLLHHSWAAWMTAALGLCLLAVVFSQSRGGFLALSGAALLCLALGSRGRRLAAWLTPQAAALLFGVAFALLVTLGFGYEQISSRLASIGEGQTLVHARGSLWLRGLASVPDFPLFGTGYGTFQYIEPIHRSDTTDLYGLNEHAHNDYLEVLIEGGVVQLALNLLAILFLCRFSVRALRRYRGSATEGLLWGAVFALGTVLIHSFGDFGLHIPAIALLVTVLCAYLCGLGDAPAAARKDEERKTKSEEEKVPSLFVLRSIPLLATLAVGFMLLGMVLTFSGWSACVIHRLRAAAEALKDRSDLDSQRQRLAYLDAMARLNPDLAEIQLARARAHMRLYSEVRGERQQRAQLCEQAEVVLDAAAAPPLEALGLFVLTKSAHEVAVAMDMRMATGQHLVSALAAYQQARDACPLVEEPHRALARYHMLYQQADSKETYLARAKYLAPGIPLVWYDIGSLELATDPEQALASWRRCLELNGDHLRQILDESRTRFPAATVRDQLLPENAEILLGAALYLYPDDQDARRPFVERALAALQRQEGPYGYPHWKLKAQTYRLLDQQGEAVKAYRAALTWQPRDLRSRLELAGCLYQENRLDEARHEVQMVLSQDPRNAEAFVLQRQVEEKRAREGKRSR